jgi:creatine kinase
VSEKLSFDFIARRLFKLDGTELSQEHLMALPDGAKVVVSTGEAFRGPRRKRPNREKQPRSPAHAKVETTKKVEVDAKDTADFKYAKFKTIPTWTDAHKSLLRQVLTADLFEQLKNTATAKSWTLSNCMQASVNMPHSTIGAVAGDEESWEVFKDVLQPIVALSHPLFDPQTEQKMDLNAEGLVLTEDQEDLFDQYVISTRIRAVRNVRGYALPAGTLSEDRAGVEAVLKTAFETFSGDLKGKYVSVQDMKVKSRDVTPPVNRRTTVDMTAIMTARGEFVSYQEKNLMFQNPPSQDSFLVQCGGARDWPKNRGIFYNADHSAACCVNTVDHCRIISTKEGGDIAKVFRRFCSLSEALGTALKAGNNSVMHDLNLGYLGSCPSNIGTSLRASAAVILPELAKRADFLEEVCTKLHLDCACEARSDDKELPGKFHYILSNKERLGLSEIELVQKMIASVCRLISVEIKLNEDPGFDDWEYVLRC